MKIALVSEQEDENEGFIHLHKEGLFWREYNWSAYWLVHHLQAVKVTKKYYKSIKEEMVLVGVPNSSMSKLLATGINQKEKGEKYICLEGLEWDETIYNKWFDAQDIEVSKSTKKEKSYLEINPYETIINRIKAYPLIRHTPLEAEQFLGKIQKELHGITQ